MLNRRIALVIALFAALFIPGVAQAQNTSKAAAQPLASGTANAAIVMPLSSGESAAGFNITGLTASGATLALEASTDARATTDSAKVWFSVAGYSAITTDQSFRADVAAYDAIRVRVTSTGNGGTILVGRNTIAGAVIGGGTANQGTPNAGGALAWPTIDTNSAAILAALQGPIPTKQSGVAAAVTGCDSHAFYDASDNGKKTIVAGVSSKKIYICGFILATGGTATNLSLTSGTGSDCVSTSTAITPAYQLLANDVRGANSPFWNGLATLVAADNLCVNASAGNAHQVEVWYTIQ